MHGQNKLRPREKNDKLQVHDIWYTIQGEGPFFGRPAIFVRLTGCNLACTFCDTQWDDANDKYRLVDDVVLKIRLLANEHKCNLVVLTGGEPCRQELGLLIYWLVSGLRMEVQIETAGTYWQECMGLTGVTIVCSPKTKHVHPKVMEHCQHWKYVIQAGQVLADGLPGACTQAVVNMNGLQNPLKWGLPTRPPQREGVTVWLSPCNEYDAQRNRANMVEVGRLCMLHGYRAQVQLHTFLELP